VSRPGISVLLPCRDAETTLAECIESLCLQTLPDFEVIAVDDCSADRTREILDRWAAHDDRVTVIGGSGSGVADALALAAERAEADLLARMDADDIAHPERLELQNRFMLERRDIAACGTGVRYFPRAILGSGYVRYEDWLNSLHEPADIDRDLFVECPLAHPTLVVRADAFNDVDGYRSVGWPEDYDLLLRLHRRGHRMANLPEVLLEWRVTQGRLSMWSEAYSAEAFRRCKVHHLLRGYLPPGRKVVLWGAGRVGKALARELLRHQLQPAAFVDLDPRKIGQTIHGAPVQPPSCLKDLRGERPYVLGAVGSPGARRDIRAALDRFGFEEPADYRMLA
jgi:glycosyltransferase involved in cell wall biosynthesis